MLTIEKVIILKAVGIFSAIPDRYLVSLATAAEVMEVPKGTGIFEKGDHGEALFIVIEGTVLIHDGDAEIAQIGRLGFFGELAALDPEARSASATAMADSRLFRIDELVIYELINDQPEVARAIIRVLCQRVRANQRLGLLDDTGFADETILDGTVFV